nr:MAG: cytochrome c [Hyphomicrobiales bacterium]
MRCRNISPTLIASLFVLATAGTQALAADAQTGKEAFDRVGCWSCHNYEGTGGRHGPAIARTQHSYEAFSAFVRNTDGEMPPFTARMVPEEDLEAIYAYLQSIPAPPSPDGISLLQGIYSE